MTSTLDQAIPSAAGSLPVTMRMLATLTRRMYRVKGGWHLAEPIRRHFLRRSGEVWFTGFDGGARLRIDLSAHMGSFIFWRGAYSAEELTVLSRLLRSDDVFVDVGANLGEFSIFASRRVPDGRVIAFEPLPRQCAVLQENLTANHTQNVDVVAAACGAMSGMAVLHVPTGMYADGSSRHEGLASLYRHLPGMDVPVPVVTLDDELARRDVRRVDVVKIDVEGAELDVLRGAADTLATQRPHVMFELNGATAEAAGRDPRSVVELLEDAGYRLHAIGRNGRLEALADPSAVGFQNVLAVPRTPARSRVEGP